MDLGAYWSDVFADAADEFAYPLVRVPGDLGRSRKGSHPGRFCRTCPPLLWKGAIVFVLFISSNFIDIDRNPDPFWPVDCSKHESNLFTKFIFYIRHFFYQNPNIKDHQNQSIHSAIQTVVFQYSISKSPGIKSGSLSSSSSSTTRVFLLRLLLQSFPSSPASLYALH